MLMAGKGYYVSNYFWDHMLQLHTWKIERKIIFRKKIIQSHKRER
jgi:hypothetical protein